MSDELKPCPFCGQPAVGGNWPYVPQSDNKQSGMVAVAMCENTACRVQPELTLYSEGGFPEETGTWEDVLAAWNTRPVEDALRKENSTLKLELAFVPRAAIRTLVEALSDTSSEGEGFAFFPHVSAALSDVWMWVGDSAHDDDDDQETEA